MRSSSTLSVNLTPMQTPDSARSQGSIPQLLLRPGEPSELVVQVRNTGSEPMQVSLQVEGNFPQDWCWVGMEGSEILPHQTMDAVLYFRVPADFFEAAEALRDRPHLNINYQGRICVHASEIETADFQLFLRPRSLYLDFLPAIYREIDFVGRFLKIFEETFEPAVQSLDALWAYLDPLTAPNALLPFLSHWVAWSAESQMSLDQQRRLIRNAMQIYRWRGTRRGLRFYLHLATGLPLDEHLAEEAKHISIFELYQRGFVLGTTHLTEDAILGGGRPFHFCVKLRPDPDFPIDEALVRRVIEQEKPAFCTYDFWIEPRSQTHDDAFSSTIATTL